MNENSAPNETASPARILTVCTGNICRSPYAERILAMYFHPEQVHVSSAGTGAAGVAGQGIEHHVAGLLPERAVREPHVSREITPQLIKEADLILTLETSHRSDVVTMVPPAIPKTFTLREAARLIMQNQPLPVPSSPRTAFKELAEVLRPLRSRADGISTDDVEDPYGGDQAAYDRMKAEMDPALAVLVRYATGQLQTA